MKERLCVLLLLLTVGVIGQSTFVTFSDCATATPGDPCVSVRTNYARDGPSNPIFNQFWPAPCAVSESGSTMLISDYRGLTVRPTSDLNTVSADTPLNCPSVQITRRTYNSNFLLTTAPTSGMAVEANAHCYCQEAGNCRERIFQITDSATNQIVLNSSYPPLGEGFSRTIYNTDVDFVNAPLILWNCTSPNMDDWDWLRPPPGAFLFSPYSWGVNCPRDYTSTIAKLSAYLGYSGYLRGRAQSVGYPSTWFFFEVPDLITLDLHQDDSLALLQAFETYGQLNISFGPSYLSDTVISADVPNGRASVSETGVVVPDSTDFGAGLWIEEALHGGDVNVVWGVMLDGNGKRVSRFDYGTSPATVTTFEHSERMIYQPVNCTFKDQNGAVMDFVLCRFLDSENIPFEWALSQSTYAGATHSVGFFSEGAQDYVIVAYLVGSPCAGCRELLGMVEPYNLDLWEITGGTPALLDRMTFDTIQSDTLAFGFYAHGRFFYSNGTGDRTEQYSFEVSAAAGLDNFRNGDIQVFTDAAVAADSVPYERYLWDADTMIVNWGKDGSTFYTINSTGIVGVLRNIPSNTGSDPISGAVLSCGEGNNFARNNAINSAGVNGVFSFVDVQLFDLSPPAPSPSVPAPSVPAPSVPAPSGPAPSPSPPMNSVGPSASPVPTTCLSPDSCKYDCSVIEPTKFPKPSVEPSKVPEPSRVPEPKFFVLELTYESDAADCGPDCCMVRDLLGNDAVAASFYMCSEASQTKNRAPEYDSGAGTCSIFLAAQEGTDSGEISEAQFDALVTTLEGNAATLCPTDAKNCDVSPQKGKTADYIIGSAASVVASLILVLAALAALL